MRVCVGVSGRERVERERQERERERERESREREREREREWREREREREERERERETRDRGCFFAYDCTHMLIYLSTCLLRTRMPVSLEEERFETDGARERARRESK